jgi:mycothiol synthase
VTAPGAFRPLTADDVATVAALVSGAEAAAGRRLVDPDGLRGAADGRGGVTGLVAPDPTDGRLAAYCQVVRGPRRWDLELAHDPEPSRAIGARVAATATLTGALDVVARGGGGEAYLWISAPSADDDRMVAAAGLAPTRDLWQVRRPLPVDDEPWSLATRPFVVGHDEQRWLAVNNRAFAWHPEQGGWSLDDLRAREREPWFDAAGFLVHDVDGEMAGFCWTKVHADLDPPLGEIYVIAVDPAHHQRGLGRALVLAGLDHLARTGLTVGMLYVDADNGPATRLYDRLGFRLHHVDRAYAADVPAADGPEGASG